MSATRREKAAHEASHAIALHRCAGQRIDLISIQGRGRLGGFVMSSPPGAPEWRPEEITAHVGKVASGGAPLSKPRERTAEEIEAAVLVALAGVEGQRIATGNKALSLGGDEFDLAEAKALLGAGRRPTWDVLADLSDARARTRAFLRQHWREVEAVADALVLGTGTLTGDQFRRLLELTAPAAAERAETPAAAPGTATGHAEASEGVRVVWHREPRPAPRVISAALHRLPHRFTPGLRVFA